MFSSRSKFLFLLSISSQLSTVKAKCNTYVDCKSCANHTSTSGLCRWCPLDRACHEPFSLQNPCVHHENIVNPQMCRDTKYGKYDPHSAFLHTLMSAAAYSNDPETCLKKMNATQDFEVIDVIRHDCEELHLFSYKECFAYTAVSHKRRLVSVTFRGTEVTVQIVDQIISVLTFPKETFPTGGKVQRYFANAHEKLYRGVNESVTKLIKKYPSYSFVVTGHSLGGALASLAAVSLVYQKVIPLTQITVYTFGEPRVGDKEFAFNYDRLMNSSWRVVHNRDIVSHLPTCELIGACSVPINGPYHHRTEIFYPNITMKEDSYYIQCRGDDSDKCSDGVITRKPCTADIIECIKYHLNYFDNDLGSLCA